tara:strand:- start:1827 stop:3140 length:1314 start_codon:yes stop_codon:yes gene_type:complete
MATQYDDRNAILAQGLNYPINTNQMNQAVSNYSALNQPSNYSAMRQAMTANNAYGGYTPPIQPVNFVDRQAKSRLANQRAVAPATTGTKTPPNWRDNLLNYVLSPKGQGMAQGLLEASGYSETPISFGQALAMGLKRGNEAEAAAAASQLAKDKFEYQKNRDLVQDVFTQQGLNLELQKLLKPNLSNFAKELRDVGIDPESPEGKKLLIDKITKSTNEINLNQKLESTFDVEGVKAGYKEIDEAKKVINANKEVNARLKILGDMLIGGDVDTGKIAEATLPIKQFLRDAGLLSKEAVDGLTAQEVFFATANYIVPRMRVVGSGQTSDFEARLFKSASPNLGNSEAGNLVIIKGMEAINDYNSRRMQLLEKYFQENKSTLGFGEYADKELGSIYERFDDDDSFDQMVREGTIKEGDFVYNGVAGQFQILTKEDIAGAE